MKNILIVSCLCFLLIGCTDRDEAFQPSGNDSLELTKLSSKGITDQQPANQAKQFLSRYEEISQVRAVNHNGQLVVAVDVYQHDRFFLDDLEKELRKDVKRNFSDMKITLSTDQKILLELKQLEDEIEANTVSNDDIKKRLHKIKKLSKEET